MVLLLYGEGNDNGWKPVFFRKSTVMEAVPYVKELFSRNRLPFITAVLEAARPVMRGKEPYAFTRCEEVISLTAYSSG